MIKKVAVKIRGTKAQIQAVKLTKITLDFVSSVKEFCKENKLDYKETLSFMLETIKDGELTENANQNQTDSNSNC